MATPDETCVLIPTLNEATTIGSVVDGFRDAGFGQVLVVDGQSDDDTAAVAREHGAEVLLQSGIGKGRAVREGLEAVETPYVLLVDGDGTYLPEDATRMVAPLNSSAEHVIGDRFADMEPGAMTGLNKIGNKLINRVFAAIHGEDFSDILSGYRAFTRDSTDRMHLMADGFGIETELAVECARSGIPVEIVDVTYRRRPADSETNLRPLRDGAVILSTLYRLAKTSNPLVYFGVLGVLSVLAAVVIGGFVLYEWFVMRTPHLVLAMVAAFGILFGIQLVTFGVLTEMILKLHR